MEAASSVAVAARGISMSMPSSRKEWRVVSDHPIQNPVNSDLDRSKLGQGDERLIYEQGRESVVLDFFSDTVAGGSDHDLGLDDVVKQREQLQHLEVNIKARRIARSEVMEMQERFDSQIKEHITANLKLQEQLHEREKAIKELQRTLADKDKELHSIRLDHEAAWAKEDLLREQNKELASFRRERDSSEAERSQHVKKIHELQEHIQEKDQQLIEMQEQNRVAQESMIYKDEQIREAQAWITRAQEMDVLQTNTNHSLQAELRERMEQYNQLWLGCQRQFAEMERLHLHAVQKLQLELRERSDETQKEPAADVHNAEIVSSTQTNQIPAAQILHYLPPVHPFVMQNVNAHQFHSSWQNQQAGSQVANDEKESKVSGNANENVGGGRQGREAESQQFQKLNHTNESSTENDKKRRVHLHLLDEESLLACVVRTIPPASVPAGRIRISQTLLNRLNKMLAPLSWADYKIKYGQLADFLAVHPELFFIEGDHIQVREGAQEIIAAMAAHAKVRAAIMIPGLLLLLLCQLPEDEYFVSD
ncbi:hypothetical protein L2E82_31540 [Cichorium intybus]|uniref:Uncharacterized protein n=1 Tax=Cichorium intybus TaxID=13427 RepID=A0ACB9BEQ5_CICIN|nr:hypothetical protein L2E82_31540 [Cichorium intybus]